MVICNVGGLHARWAAHEAAQRPGLPALPTHLLEVLRGLVRVLLQLRKVPPRLLLKQPAGWWRVAGRGGWVVAARGGGGRAAAAGQAGAALGLAEWQPAAPNHGAGAHHAAGEAVLLVHLNRMAVSSPGSMRSRFSVTSLRFCPICGAGKGGGAARPSGKAGAGGRPIPESRKAGGPREPRCASQPPPAQSPAPQLAWCPAGTAPSASWRQLPGRGEGQGRAGSHCGWQAAAWGLIWEPGAALNELATCMRAHPLQPAVAC